MIELKYVIPKINGKDLTYQEIAILIGYKNKIESDWKEKEFKNENEMMKFINENTLSAQKIGELKIRYTELIDNPLSEEDFVKLKFQKKISEIILDLLNKKGLENIISKIDITGSVDNLKKI